MKLEERHTELESHIDEAEEPGNLLRYNETWKPHYYQFALDIRAEHEKSHWTEEEIDLSDDVAQWKGNQLTDVEKSHILNILRLFTQSDVAVGQVYADYFIPKFKNTDVRNMLTSFAAREAIHMHAYALLNDSLGLPEEEYHAFLEYAVMKEKIEFMTDADVSTYRGLALALAKAVFNEGLTLFASFVMLLNYERLGKMKGMGKIASWSLVDESCVIEGTEVLKEDGSWIPIEDVMAGDVILAYDVNDGLMKFQEVQATTHTTRSDVCYRVVANGVEQFVTDNHRLILGDNTDVETEILFYRQIDGSEQDSKMLVSADVDDSVDVSCFDDPEAREFLSQGKVAQRPSITQIKLYDDTDFYCVSVPGTAFVIRGTHGGMTITGNCHVKGVSELFKAFCAEHPRIVDDEFKKAIYDMARQVVSLEDRFITKAYELGEVDGMTSDEVRKYIRYVADRRLQQIGLKENWHVKENPIKWLDWVTGDRHASFFETRVTEYDSTLGGSLKGSWDYPEVKQKQVA